MTKAFLLAAAAATMTIVAVTGAPAQDTMGGPNMPADATPTAAMPFIAMAGASDLYEMQSSQMALSKSRSPAVRSFAQMMIRDHSTTTRAVMHAAHAAGMNPPPPMLMPMQRDMLAQLEPLTGAEFDRMYLQQQLQAHQMALALHQNYAANGDTRQLRMAASSAVPIVRRHLDHVRSLAR